jgi:hypothetical protein
MTTKKTERIMYYDESERRWMVDTMELEEKNEDSSQTSEEDNKESEKRMVY